MKNRLLNLAFLTLALALPLPAQTQNLQELIRLYQERQDKATPSSVLDSLRAGNARFVAGTSTHGGYPIDARERIQVSSPSQRPLAAVLSCIDSRTTPELAFDVTVGDLFTARVGANVVNDDILGSLEIATESGAKVVVILGHKDCGGVKGAISGLDLGHMTQLLDRVKPAIARTHAKLDSDPALNALVGERVITNRRYIAAVSHMNAVQSTEYILTHSPILKAKVESGDITLVTALFDVETGKVEFDVVK